MKMKFSVVGALAACMMSATYAAPIVYLNESGVTDLSDGAAWDGGVAVFHGTTIIFHEDNPSCGPTSRFP